METITKYRTSDGKEYDDRTVAEAHERELERARDRAPMLWIDRRLDRLRDAFWRHEDKAETCRNALGNGSRRPATG